MPKALKEQLREMLERRGREVGVENFIDMIADETVATTEEETLAFIEKAGHPVLSIEPMM